MPADFPDALQFLFERWRYKIAYGGRGGAKSWNFARALLIQGCQRPLRILCARETQRSIADSVHKLLCDQIQELNLGTHYSIQKSTILGPSTEFIFAGLRHNVHNIKSIEACDIVWVEEGQNTTKESWEVLIPTIRKENSEIWVSFNPELDTDDTYRRFVVNPPPNAKVVKVTFRDNPWFPEVLRIEMEHLRRTDEQAYLHVYEGETRSSVEGAVYEEEMKDAQSEGRIADVPYDRTRPVDTFWDLGFGDQTAIWFAQPIAGWYHFIDYLADDGRSIDWYLVQLQNKGYLYGTDWLPHDGLDIMIHAKLGGDRSRSIEMIMRDAGRNVRMVPKMSVMDGINASRTILPQCRFDVNKCYEGLRAMRMYRWAPPAASGALRREPVHDLASHGADAFRAAALSLRQPAFERHVSKPAARTGSFPWSVKR